ncbi:hypothetical protein BDQ17DRAFT_1375568 [Cyathus striatus]|nr:hypothetical protein BDQ17DRAFT_1375568 [Cyathus striatus]
MSQITTRHYYGRRSNIDTLPNDVLLEIFYIASRHISSHSTKRKPTAIAISVVCSRWRQLALHYPLMWTNIYIPTYPDCYVDITLNTTTGRDGYAFYNDRYLRISQLIKENTTRIRSFSIRISHVGLLRKFSKSFQTKAAPVLQTLEITIESIESTELGLSPDHDLPIFDDVPSLRSLRINQVPFDFLPPFGASLAHFDTENCYLTFEKFQRLFDSCPNLTSLIIRKFTCCPLGSYIHEGHLLQFEAPRLQSLVINLNYRANSDNLEGCMCPITNLTAPNLKYLEISNLPRPPPGLLEHLTKFTKSCIASGLTIRLNCAELTGCLPFLKDLPQETILELANVTTEALPQVLSMSNFSKIALDLKSIPQSKWSDIFPWNADSSSPVVLHVPPSSFCNPHLLKALSTRESVSMTSSLFGEGVIGVNSYAFFAAEDDEYCNYWDEFDVNFFASDDEGQSGSYYPYDEL